MEQRIRIQRGFVECTEVYHGMYYCYGYESIDQLKQAVEAAGAGEFDFKWNLGDGELIKTIAKSDSGFITEVYYITRSELGVDENEDVNVENIARFVFSYKGDDKYRVYLKPSKEKGTIHIFRCIHPDGATPYDYENGMGYSELKENKNDLDGGAYFVELIESVFPELV